MSNTLDKDVGRTPRQEVSAFVANKIYRLQSGYLSERGRSAAARDLALLRRAASRKPGETSETYALECEGLPASLAGKGAEPPTRGEWAVHAGLTLYATHQQSVQREMFKRDDAYGIGVGAKWLEILKRQETGEQGPLTTPSRFAALVTADSIEEALHYARQLVQQLRDKEIPLDHARLAGQLFDFQNPYRRDRVRLEWGREFARQLPQSEEKDGSQAEA